MTGSPEQPRPPSQSPGLRRRHRRSFTLGSNTSTAPRSSQSARIAPTPTPIPSCDSLPPCCLPSRRRIHGDSKQSAPLAGHSPSLDSFLPAPSSSPWQARVSESSQHACSRLAPPQLSSAATSPAAGPDSSPSQNAAISSPRVLSFSLKSSTPCPTSPRWLAPTDAPNLSRTHLVSRVFLAQSERVLISSKRRPSLLAEFEESDRE